MEKINHLSFKQEIKLVLLIFTVLLFIFCVPNSFSQCSAFPTGPGDYTSVDPPTLVWQNYMMPGCTEILLGRSSPPYCPIQGPNPPLIQIFASFPITQTCMLFTNGYWNSWDVNVNFCWGTRVYGGGMNWQPGFNLTRLAAALPVVSLIYPANGLTITSTTPLMDWSNISDANSYRLSIYSEACCINVIYDTTTSFDSITIPPGKLSGNTMYYWRVKPYKTGGEGPFSDPFNFITGDAPPPVLISPPFNSTIYSTTPLVDWYDVPEAIYYHITITPSEYPYFPPVFDSIGVIASEITIPADKLLPGKSYDWAVRAYSSLGFGGWSDWWHFSVSNLPGFPQLLLPWIGALGVSLTPVMDWTISPEAISYNIQVSKSINFDINIVDTMASNVPPFQMPGGLLQNDSVYYWRVRGYNPMGFGPWSAVFYFQTISLLPPEPVVLASPLNNSTGIIPPVTVSWNASPSAVEYFVQVAYDSLFSNMYQSSQSIDTFYVLAIYDTSKFYYWRVQVHTSGWWSEWSEIWKFKTLGLPTQVNLIYPPNNSVNQPVNLTFLWGRSFDDRKLLLKTKEGNKFSKTGTDVIQNYCFELTTDTITMAGLIRDMSLTDTLKFISGLNNNTAYYWRVNTKNEIGWGNFSVWFKFTTLVSLNVNIAYTADWNMVSLPVNANPNGVRSLFPNCTPPAFYYNNGYQSDTILIPGKGYWLFFNSGGNQNISGLPVDPQVIPVMQDWNMIGVFENNVLVNSITSNPPGIINSSFFKYSNGYIISDTLKPGSAYWVNVTQAGNLILPSSADKLSTVFKEKENQNVLNANLVRLIISDNSDKNSILYLGRKEELQGTYILPPLPPAGIFDARFGSGTYAEVLGQSKHVINIQTGKYPVKIKTENLTGLKLQLKDNITGKLVDRVLTDNTEITVNEHISSFVLIEEELPKVFSLSQNYPNPFNPLTHIKFGVPVKTNVKLVIYDLLGQEVRTLVNEMKDAGYYTIDFNAEDISSGVYFYRMDAGNFSDVKKLLVIK